MEWGWRGGKKLVAAVASIPNGGNGRLNGGYHAAFRAENIETAGRPSLVCIERWRRSRFCRSIPLSPVNTLGNDRQRSAVVERFAFVVIGATIAIIAGSLGGKDG